ncbi:MAG: hypothetical protein GY858_05565 [Candidatus Omnitrophica bacterium]|nr:hypothetical protein [Candidatus Omnitrophota bacterium]
MTDLNLENLGPNSEELLNGLRYGEIKALKALWIKGKIPLNDVSSKVREKIVELDFGFVEDGFLMKDKKTLHDGVYVSINQILTVRENRQSMATMKAERLK